MMHHITDLTPSQEKEIRQAARILREAFQHLGAWSTEAEALEEVHESFAPGRISRVALDENGSVLGWVGAISSYEGRVWELHPLCVGVNVQGQRIGRSLVEDLEAQVRARGGLTITLGTDDEIGQTSLYGADLYQNLWEKVAHIQNLKRHPYEFYQKIGYIITGVVPDANGIGKPDIIMSKRVDLSGYRGNHGT